MLNKIVRFERDESADEVLKHCLNFIITAKSFRSSVPLELFPFSTVKNLGFI